MKGGAGRIGVKKKQLEGGGGGAIGEDVRQGHEKGDI